MLAAKAIWSLVEVGLASSSSHGGLMVVTLLVYPKNLSSCQVRIDSWKMVMVQLKTTCNYKRKKKDSVKIKMFKRSLIRTKKVTFFFSSMEIFVGGKQHIMEKNWLIHCSPHRLYMSIEAISLDTSNVQGKMYFWKLSYNVWVGWNWENPSHY